jgi:A/G-specific adenine glycosylase
VGYRGFDAAVPYTVVSTLQYELYLLHPDKPDKIERGVRTHVQCRFSNFDMNHQRLPITSGDILQFRRRLLRWYDRHKRDLPWRQDRDVYRVWLSEIMLQQTRVAAVLEHYREFVKRFPSVQRLARARESSVLAAWSGLGYYRRARMLRRAATEIVSKHAGQFPDTAAKLRDLPGIGPYTAAAIASICFGQRVAVVDGNVERVLSRITGRNLVRAEVWHFAQEFLSLARPGDFNQAMMELGATVCQPVHPKCLLCPVSSLCATRGELARIAITPHQKKKEISYLLDRRNGSVLLIQRTQRSSLMPGMWELPEIPSANGSRVAWITVRHSVTTTDYLVRVVKGRAPERTQGSWVRVSRLAELPLTGLTRKILRSAKVI